MFSPCLDFSTFSFPLFDDLKVDAIFHPSTNRINMRTLIIKNFNNVDNSDISNCKIWFLSSCRRLINMDSGSLHILEWIEKFKATTGLRIY